MAHRSLAGTKIAVLVESQSIPAERVFSGAIADYVAEVQLMSRLRDRPKQTFVSEAEEVAGTPERFDVVTDFAQVKFDDYAAVITAANYPSVRLRCNGAAATGPDTG
jgi:hypothetical protein